MYFNQRKTQAKRHKGKKINSERRSLIFDTSGICFQKNYTFPSLTIYFTNRESAFETIFMPWSSVFKLFKKCHHSKLRVVTN